jgi:L-alanine-DL-glutamate epimerase-like enolase superfamily enzyme
MKITAVEAIYVRQQQVKIQCDSGQDALIVKVSTDEGITGSAKSIRIRSR